MNDQTKKIGVLHADVDRLQKQLDGVQAKLAKLETANTKLQVAKADLAKQLDRATVELEKVRLAEKTAGPIVDKALQEKCEALEEKYRSTEIALAEWTELAKV